MKNGFAALFDALVLIKSSTLINVQGYIRQVYLMHNKNTTLCFQIQHLYKHSVKVSAEIRRTLFAKKRNRHKDFHGIEYTSHSEPK